MNKRIIVILAFVLSSFAMMAQGKVGIYTENTEGVLHIDAKKNNGSGDPNSSIDDVLINGNGGLGLGALIFKTKLYIDGKFRYVDGNQLNGKVLVSDADGNASWKDLPNALIVEATGDVATTLTSHSVYATPSYSGVEITLPAAGTWQIFFTVGYTGQANIYWDLCASSTVYDLQDTNDMRSMSSAGSVATISATYFVQVNEPTTLYLWSSAPTLTGGIKCDYMGGGAMWAMPVGS